MRLLAIRLLLALTCAAAWRACSSAPPPIPWRPPKDASFGLPSESISTTGATSRRAGWLAARSGSTPSSSLLAGLMRIIGGTAVAQGSAISTHDNSQPTASIATRLLQGSSLTAEPNFRIVGGQPATPIGRYRYIVSLRDNKGLHYCAGTLISDRVIMSAAHCLDHPEDALRRPTVIVGKFYNKQDETNVVKTRCAASYVHEGWSFVHGQNDVSLCVLAEPVKGIAPVQLEHTPWSDANAPLTVLGWGASQEGGRNNEQLQSTQVYLMDYKGCNTTYSGRIAREEQICAGVALGGSDACQGDSGGPLIQAGSNAAEDVQVGIVSWGSGCGEAGKPGVYTQVAYYVPWINAKLKSVLGITLPEPAMTDEQKQACTCSEDGRCEMLCHATAPVACSTSGTITVKEKGCKQHDITSGNVDYYCYVTGGPTCRTATASDLYQKAAAWRPCTPTSADAADAGISTSSDAGSSAGSNSDGSSSSTQQYPLIMTAVGSDGHVVDDSAGSPVTTGSPTAAASPKVVAAGGPAPSTRPWGQGFLGQMIGAFLGGGGGN